jgi:hypothetical protein
MEVSTSAVELARQGFQLELHIQQMLNRFDIENYKETEIRSKFHDQSLNGVDHLVFLPNTNTIVFIQDKWRKQTNQKDVSQFINCVMNIQTYINDDEKSNDYTKYELLWVSKSMIPTSHAMKSLNKRRVGLILCDCANVETLAVLTVMHLLKLGNVDVCSNTLFDVYSSLSCNNAYINSIEIEVTKEDEQLMNEMEQNYNSIQCAVNYFGVQRLLNKIYNQGYYDEIRYFTEWFHDKTTTKELRLTDLICNIVDKCKKDRSKQQFSVEIVSDHNTLLNGSLGKYLECYNVLKERSFYSCKIKQFLSLFPNIETKFI